TTSPDRCRVPCVWVQGLRPAQPLVPERALVWTLHFGRWQARRPALRRRPGCGGTVIGQAPSLLAGRLSGLGRGWSRLGSGPAPPRSQPRVCGRALSVGGRRNPGRAAQRADWVREARAWAVDLGNSERQKAAWRPRRLVE